MRSPPGRATRSSEETGSTVRLAGGCFSPGTALRQHRALGRDLVPSQMPRHSPDPLHGDTSLGEPAGTSRRSPAGKMGSILHHNSHLHLVFLLLDPLPPSLSLLSLHPPLHLAFVFLFFSSFSPSFPFFVGTPTHTLTHLHLPVPDSTEPLGALGQLRAQHYHRQRVNGSRVKNFLCYFPLICLCEYLARSVTTEDWKCSCHGPLHGTF